MSQVGVVGAALGSALAAATSTVLQHRSARTAPEATAADHRLLGHLLTRPMWLAGLLAAAAGLVLHALALSGGRLALVQPVLVSGLLFALPLSVILEGRRLSAAAVLWALVLVIGLAGFLLAGRPSAGRVSADTDVLAVATLAGCVLVAGIAAAGRVLDERYKGAVLAMAAGIGYGVVAALLKQATSLVGGGWLRLLTGWPVYALVVVGAASIALTQLAYRAGSLAMSLPTLTITDPASSVAVGALVFHERLTHTPIAVVVEVACFGLMFAATAALASGGATGAPPP
jgi:drug/metabolite transporter (DMT)-like permease